MTIVLLMSNPFLPTPFSPRPSNPPDESFIGTEGQDEHNLATSIEQQRARVQARRVDGNGLVRSRQQEEQRCGDRLAREKAATQDLLRRTKIA
jgi:hypothetical protein